MTAGAITAAPIATLLPRVRSRWLPPPRLTVSAFADRELIITSGPLAGSHWRTDFAEYQRGILDAFHEAGVEIVVVRSSAQVGKTSIVLALIAYHVIHDPCAILIVQPTVQPMAEDFSKNRLDPLIAATPALKDVFAPRRSKDSSNTILQKTFRGGALSIAGANSAASLAARTVRLLLLDEIDRYPAELPGEGSTLQIAMKRTAAFRGRRRILLVSTPTLEGAPIDAWYKRGDQREFEVPCPACGAFFAFHWRDVRWRKDDPTTARIHCPSCDYGLDDAERKESLAHGSWQPTVKHRPEANLVSFHLWEGMSPFSSIVEIVRNFLSARAAQKRGDAAEMHTWINTTLGEPIQPEEGEGAESGSLLLRREVYAFEVPAGACCLTMGVDTQDDRLEALVVGWGPGEEAWFVDRRTLPGDPSQPEVWHELDALVERRYHHASGARLPIDATCVDSAGHRTTQVYEYVARQGARRVYAIIGRDGDRPIVSSPKQRQWGRGRRKVPLYVIGVDAAKALLFGRLKVASGPGAIHLPQLTWLDEGFVSELTSERLVKRFTRGVPREVWRKIRPRNEALDCSVYALAALRLLRPNLEDLAGTLAQTAPVPPAPAPAPTRPRWIQPRAAGWLRRGR